MVGRSAKATKQVDDERKPRTYEELRAEKTNQVDYDKDHGLKAPPEYDLLYVQDVELNIRKNTVAHHTDEFDITDIQQSPSKTESLVVRRGQPFELSIHFNRPYDKSVDDLRIIFTFGEGARPSNGSYVEFILSAKDEPKEWGALIQSQKDKTLTLKMLTPPTCPVGQWKLQIDMVKKVDKKTAEYKYWQPGNIYILFNPWCKDDLVYMPDTKLLNEYVLNETGKIYSGSYCRISPKPWVFGQFSGNVLECSTNLLQASDLTPEDSGNPILVTRKISKMVNSADEQGVLTGNWSGNYEGGCSPLDWVGSQEILEEYHKTGRPVKYGQCWVFSGVVTTVCRALGIPARSVTNFASAHDTDGSITIDRHFDAEGNCLDYMNSDSVWNFHVWNDCWMARPDLPPGYGGWQAIDATPQETSDGVFCMGPMSLYAVKRGEVHLPYDGKFLFGEVNADRIYWRVMEDGSMKKMSVQKYSVGRRISTKAPVNEFSWSEYSHGIDKERQDITSEYKFADGATEERAAVRAANLRSEKPGVYDAGPQIELSPCSIDSGTCYLKVLPKPLLIDGMAHSGDVTFELIAKEDTFMGDDIEVVLKITNTSDSKRTLGGKLSLSTMYYTGVHHKDIDYMQIVGQVIEAGQSKEVKLVVTNDNYLDNLIDHCMCRISCMVGVKETGQTLAKLDELRLRKPHLTIKAQETGKVGEKFKVEVSFVNPLPKTLTMCELRVEGPGLQKPVTHKQKNVDAKGTFNNNFEMTPAKTGSREIIVYFNCKQISAVTGSHTIKIQ